MNIVGIESSCDETSVAVITENKIKSNLISSQEFHTNFGGVVPELSSRAHLQTILPLFKKALNKAEIELKDIDLICATAGPGLIGALLVGLNFAKGLSLSLKVPFVPVNHIEGHLFSGFLMPEKPVFPFLSLLVSGGHTLLLLVKSDTEIIKIGGTIDDAAGEAFDKVSKMLGLGYPGGQKIQEYAERNNEEIVKFPVARLKNELDFSFSGLKTSVLRFIQENYNGEIPEKDKCLIADSFQKAAVKALTSNFIKALNNYKVKSISIAGGVAANKHLQSEMKMIADKSKIKLVVPELSFCGDNAAMIAYRGFRLFENRIIYPLDYNAFPKLKNSFQLP